MIPTISTDSLRFTQYDSLLAGGWFRSTDHMYLADLICIGEGLFSAQHIRLDVTTWAPRKSHRKVLRNIQKLRVIMRESHLTERHLELYKAQTSRFQSFVLSDPSGIFHNPNLVSFRTMEVALYDDTKMIAFSLFDIGFNSMASILCCYDSSYGKFSPGIATMLLELKYAQDNGIKYYYPGYVLDEPSRMEYKLGLGTYEYLSENGWTVSDSKPILPSTARYIKETGKLLGSILHQVNVAHRTFIYPLYTLATNKFIEAGDICPWPFIIELSDYSGIYISPDPVNLRITVFKGEILEKVKFPDHVWPSKEFLDNDHFLLKPLKVCEILDSDLIKSGDNPTTIILKITRCLLMTVQTNFDNQR